MANNWDELLTDVLVEIAKRIRMSEDYVAFRGVCTSWRSAATKDNFMFRNCPVPLLMLQSRNDSHVLDFYNLTHGIVNQVSLSEPLTGKKCYSSKGCLIIIDQSLNVNLMHPFSNLQHKFPNMKTIEGGNLHPDSLLITKCVLSSNPLLEPDYMLMVIYGTRKLVYARPGDETWTVLSQDLSGYWDITYYEGQIYAASFYGRIKAYKVGEVNNSSKKEQVAKLPIKFPPHHPPMAYIVESARALLIVLRYIHYGHEVSSKFRTFEFVVFNLDLSTRTYTEVKDLDNRIIFLDQLSSFSSAHLPNCKPNSIYFTEKGVKDMGIYSLQDGSITFTSHVGHESSDPITPPMWIEL
ncbi:hypothetical protein EZV62_023272 [Acer yangbiense]|uniref:KIB1-4 beta-propeller domain-containing protein n=1 Tax=Acer yangbiense TaxID=1000413 RepID=A0A5C7H144_9ROSI|nr:hypothetical protein EZV62_023272 [Acer yangbiense]